MKRLLLLLAYLTCQILCFAQIIENPAFERSDIPAFHITKVEITKDTTYIFCSYYAEEGSWACISKDTYLRDSKSQKLFPILRSDGFPYSPETRSFLQGESCQLLFCFPSIVGTEQFDFIENEGEKAFNIYNVSLKRSYKTEYSEMDLKHISEMVSVYDSSKDSEKAILYKDYATSLYDLVSYNISKGNYAEAIKLGTVEVEIREKVFGSKHQSYFEALDILADCYANIGNYKGAIRVWEEVAKAHKQVFGSESQNYVNALENLVSYNRELRNWEETLRLQIEVTNIKKEIYGADRIEYAHSLANLAVCYSDYGNHNEAIKYGTEAIEIYNKCNDVENPDYIKSLCNLSYYYFEIGKYREAIRLGTEATEILKNVDGAEYNYATILSRIADYYTYLGDFKEALQLGTEAIGIIKTIVGTKHPEYARSLCNLARLYSSLGNYTKAIGLGTEAMVINKSVFGIESPNYATSLSNLATYYEGSGNYLEAIQLGTEAIEINKRVYGIETPDYATSLNNLSYYNRSLGDYTKAIKLGTEAIEIYKRVLYTEHPLYANTLNNLALYNSEVGNYSEAIRLGTEAMELYKKILGTNHPDYATSLNNLALYNSKVGDYSEALRLETESMEIRKRVLGTNHPDYATSLSGLAVYSANIGNYSEAIRLGTESMEIRKRVLGKEHPLLGMSLLNLANYNSYIGNYSEAIKLGTEAMETCKKGFGTDHSFYAMSLRHLAKHHKNTGNYSEAIRLGTEALEICKKVLSTDHPLYWESLYDLSGYYFILGKYNEAFNYLRQSLSKIQSLVLRNFTEFPSRIQETMWTNEIAIYYNIILPYITTKYHTKQTISELYDKTCLFAKGILLNTNIEIRKLILGSGDSDIIDRYNTLSSNISIYNKLIEKPIKERFMNADSLNRVIEQQEMELSRESKAYGDYTHNLTISWKDVQRRLGDNDIAIEFLNFPIYNTDSTLYVALTLKKRYDSPHMVTLFEEKQLKTISDNDYFTQTGMSDLVWKPLEEELKGIRNIYFSPSGELHRIGIEYLPISKTKNINDDYTLYRLSSTRQLAVIHDKTDGKNTILYGGINYDEKSSRFSTDSTSTGGTFLRSAFTRANVDSMSLRSSFDYLEGTKREADMIAEGMKQHRVPYIYYSGKDGSEESFKQLDGTKPKTMHIATHGFYFTEDEAEKSKFFHPKMELVTDGFQNVGRPVEDKTMTRSGLLFSGCNRAFRHEQIPEGEEDGILTAQEIAMLDLRGLDLVVLSACQTGLGDVISGEGVFGLQRAFKKAGANTILMTLDKVDDEATKILMVEFYRNLMNGKTKRQSLQEAQHYLRKIDNGKYDDPKYWASFIMLDGLN